MKLVIVFISQTRFVPDPRVNILQLESRRAASSALFESAKENNGKEALRKQSERGEIGMWEELTDS